MALPTLLLFVAVLAWPVSMGVMMWMMNHSLGSQQPDHSIPSDTGAPARLDALREQRRQLDAEIAVVETIAALETWKQALAVGPYKAE